MKRIIGLILFLSGLAFTLSFDLKSFLDIPSILLVLLLSTGLILLEYKENFTRSDLILSIKKNTIISGWLGFLIGLIMIFSNSDSNELSYYSSRMAIALITVFYGYILAYISEFFNKN